MLMSLISAISCVSIKTHPRIVSYLHWDNRSWRCVFHTGSSVILHNSGPHLRFSICETPRTKFCTPTCPLFTKSHGSHTPGWESSLAQSGIPLVSIPRLPLNPMHCQFIKPAESAALPFLFRFLYSCKTSK